MSRAGQTFSEMTVADRIRQLSGDMTPAEQKVSRILFASAMVAGLETVASLAERAGVSGPTVIRLTSKLGFDSYIDFQRVLRGEMEERGNSPLSLYSRSRDSLKGDLLSKSRDIFAGAVRQSFDRISPGDYHAVIEVLCDPKKNIYFAGGRFSQLLAQLIYLHLYQMRPGVRIIQAGQQSRDDQLLEIGPKSVLMMFDFRRYQSDSVSLARAAHDLGARILLMTDPWESPIAEFADHVLTVEVTSSSPYDSMVPAFALAEALIAGVLPRLGKDAIRRMENLEELRTGFEWRNDAALAPGRGGKKRAKARVRITKDGPTKDGPTTSLRVKKRKTKTAEQ